ncbi:hypothetical protein TNCV_899811 [Trichonephila clavipes]|nr:hypothetical protein TNCV_899811 [Trichonephila clavipes]
MSCPVSHKKQIGEVTKREESGNRCSRFSFNQGAPRGGLLRYNPCLILLLKPRYCKRNFTSRLMTGVASSEEPCIEIPSGPLFRYGSSVKGTGVTHLGASVAWGARITDMDDTVVATPLRLIYEFQKN